MGIALDFVSAKLFVVETNQECNWYTKARNWTTRLLVHHLSHEKVISKHV